MKSETTNQTTETIPFAIVPETITSLKSLNPYRKVFITYILQTYRIQKIDKTPWTYSVTSICAGTGLERRTTERIIKEFVKEGIFKHYGIIKNVNPKSRPTNLFTFDYNNLESLVKRLNAQESLTVVIDNQYVMNENDHSKPYLTSDLTSDLTTETHTKSKMLKENIVEEKNKPRDFETIEINKSGSNQSGNLKAVEVVNSIQSAEVCSLGELKEDSSIQPGRQAVPSGELKKKSSIQSASSPVVRREVKRLSTGAYRSVPVVQLETPDQIYQRNMEKLKNAQKVDPKVPVEINVPSSVKTVELAVPYDKLKKRQAELLSDIKEAKVSMDNGLSATEMKYVYKHFQELSAELVDIEHQLSKTECLKKSNEETAQEFDAIFGE